MKNKLKTISVGLTMAGCVMFTSSYAWDQRANIPIPFMTQDGSGDYEQARNLVNKELDKIDDDVHSLPVSEPVQKIINEMEIVDFDKVFEKIALVKKETECENKVARAVKNGQKVVFTNFEVHKTLCKSMQLSADKDTCNKAAYKLWLETSSALFGLGITLKNVCTSRVKPNKSTILPGVCRNDNVLLTPHCKTLRQYMQAVVDSSTVKK